jgi:hypothetical protein
VNNRTTLEAPAGAIDQLGHSLMRVIHAFAEARADAKIFMVKYDIKDGFWRLDCEEGEEWDFAYVLPQLDDGPVRLVVPTLLQMGWVESPPYFCAASETARDVATQYIEKEVGSLPKHKFSELAMDSDAVRTRWCQNFAIGWAKERVSFDHLAQMDSFNEQRSGSNPICRV